MLRVTVEIYPFGGVTGRQIINTIDIANRGGGVKQDGCPYDYVVDGEPWGTNKTLEHNRRDGALVLVSKVLEEYLK